MLFLQMVGVAFAIFTLASLLSPVLALVEWWRLVVRG